MRAFWLSAVIAGLLCLPLLFTLSPYPQNPDGAEIVITAVHGGVMHPSGQPLHGWLNRAAVSLSPLSAEHTLSVMSLLAHLAALLFLFLAALELGIPLWAAAAAAAAYGLHRQVWAMAVQPEKYAALAAWTLACVWLFLRGEVRGWTRARMITLSMVFALALTHHTATVVVVPILAWALWRSRQDRMGVTLAMLLSVSVVALLYVSLLFQRSSSAWPDWGQLSSLAEVWSHIVRADYGVTGLHNTTRDAVRMSGLELLVTNLLPWALLTPALIVGLWALWQSRPGTASAVMISTLLALAVIAMAQLPAVDQQTALGYADRYPCLALPFLALWLAVGLAHSPAQKGWQLLVMAACVGSLLFTGFTSWRELQHMPNTLTAIFRQELGRELPADAIYFTDSDFEGFYGVPCAKGLCFPVKSMLGFAWYRERTLTSLDPRLHQLIQKTGPIDLPTLLKRAVAEGHTIAGSTAAPFLEDAEFMKHAEQRGLLWVFSTSQRALYTDEILKSSLRLCADLSQSPTGLPERGFHFTAAFLVKFSYVFRSASDFLSANAADEQARLAQAVAEQLRPGTAIHIWRHACAEYTRALTKAH